MAEKKKSVPSNSSDRKGQFVLVADQNESNVSYISTLLRRFGYRTLRARTGREVLSMVTTIVPALALISVELQDITGFELIRQLKQSRTTSPIPLIGLVDRETQTMKDHLLELGAAGCLFQPVEPEILYRTMQFALEKNPRTSMRVRAILPVKVHSMRHDTLYGAYALALSTGGMFLRTMNPVTVNSEISLEFDLNGRAIAADTVVVYNCQAGCGPDRETGIGLRFIDIAPKDKDIIREFIKNEVMKGIASVD